jgi:hypothetical protein
MAIFKINKDKTIAKVALGTITAEEILKRDGFVELDETQFPESKFLIWDDNDKKVIVDLESEQKFKEEQTDFYSKLYLKKTDFTLLADNPLNLSEEELSEVIEYRKSLREAVDTLPEVPTCIQNILEG